MMNALTTSDMVADEYGDEMSRYQAGTELVEDRERLLGLGFRIDSVDAMTIQGWDV